MKKVKRKDKIKTLIESINTHKPVQAMEIVYLFYDIVDGRPALFDDPDYDETMKSMVVKCIT